MSFWARSPPFTDKNQPSLCLAEVSVEIRCQLNPLPFPLPRVGLPPFLFLSALQRTFDSCSSDQLLIFRIERASSWGQGTAARGILVTVGFSLVLLGPSFKSQRCRELVQGRANIKGLRPCRWHCQLRGHLKWQPLLSHVQVASLGSACRWQRAPR